MSLVEPLPGSICISDSFHFSSFYTRDSSGTLAGEITDDTSSDGDPSHSDGSDGDDDPVAATTSRPTASPEWVKLKFYSQVLGDGTENIHYGKWDGIDQDQPGAYGRASEAMTNYMFNLSMALLPHRAEATDFRYIDLGSGTGAAANQLIEMHPRISEVTCLNLCPEQNATAKERAAAHRSGRRLRIVEASFDATACPARRYDLAFSQDAFLHATHKGRAYAEAYRITRPGGAFVFCDLLCGDAPGLTIRELSGFADENRIEHWLDPGQVVAACAQAGWADVKFVDLTTDLRISFQLMLKKVTFILEHGDVGSNVNRVLLMNYRDSICRRITQIDRGIFKWGVIHARKPVRLHIACEPPVPFKKTNHLILSDTEDTNVVVVDIMKKFTKDAVAALPPTVELLITLSAGLDHIDVEACRARGIVVKQSGRDAITSHVAQYTLGFLILGLRDALHQLGVSFPATGWNLNWNCEGKALTSATIAIVGLGLIAKTLVEEVRKLAPDARIIYHVPKAMRDFEAENKFNIEYIHTLPQLASQCDVLLPLCPLTKHTEHLIGKDVIANLKPHAGIINVSRGKVVDTDALTEALENKLIKYAILDTTFPEPLPADHRLWKVKNCFIFPHYATNTMDVREALVSEIQPIIEDHYGLGHSDARRKAQEKALRFDLAVAHRLTAKYDMDMLVWNHISSRFRMGFLVTPGRKMWGNITPEDLVYSSSNVTADVIHDAIYSARPDIKAVIHLHTPAATAISCLQTGFQPLTQDGAYFYGKVATYNWDGLSDDESEGPQIASAITAVVGCNTLLMHNHGYACFGSSVREAWVLAYYFERCCEVQLRVMQCGGKIRHPPKAVMKKAMQTSYLPEFAPGVCEWGALCEEISFE